MPILLYSYSWFIYNFVILFLLFLVCVNKKIKKSSYFIIFVFFIIFSVYGYITADYNSYLELMKMSKVNDPLVALEPIYLWYIQLISGNYFEALRAQGAYFSSDQGGVDISVSFSYGVASISASTTILGSDVGPRGEEHCIYYNDGTEEPQ